MLGVIDPIEILQAELVNGFATAYQKLAKDSVAELTPKAPKKAA